MIKSILTSMFVSGVTALLVTQALTGTTENSVQKVDMVDSVRNVAAIQGKYSSLDSEGLEELQQDIQSLLEYQHQLTDENQMLLQRVSQLEQATGQLSTKQESVMSTQDSSDTSTAEVSVQPLRVADPEGNQVFEDLKSQLLNEDYDDQWGLEMDASFQEIRQRLQDAGMGNVEILEKDCHSESCYVEFSHPSDINTTVFAAMVIPQGISNIMFDNSSEGDVVITRAIYQR